MKLKHFLKLLETLHCYSVVLTCTPLKTTQVNQLSRRHQEKAVVDQHYLTPDYLANNIIKLLRYFILLQTCVSLTSSDTDLKII